MNEDQLKELAKLDNDTPTEAKPKTVKVKVVTQTKQMKRAKTVKQR